MRDEEKRGKRQRTRNGKTRGKKKVLKTKTQVEERKWRETKEKSVWGRRRDINKSERRKIKVQKQK